MESKPTLSMFITPLFEKDKVYGTKELDIGKSIDVGLTYPYAIASCKGFEKTHLKVTTNEKYILLQNTSINYGSYLRIPQHKFTEMPYGCQVLIGNTWLTIINCETRVLLNISNEEFNQVANYLCDKNNEITIGCSKGQILIPEDTSISSNHIKFEFCEGVVKAMDFKDGIGSTNGSWVRINSIEYTDGSNVDLKIGNVVYAG